MRGHRDPCHRGPPRPTGPPPNPPTCTPSLNMSCSGQGARVRGTQTGRHRPCARHQQVAKASLAMTTLTGCPLLFFSGLVWEGPGNIPPKIEPATPAGASSSLPPPPYPTPSNPFNMLLMYPSVGWHQVGGPVRERPRVPRVRWVLTTCPPCSPLAGRDGGCLQAQPQRSGSFPRPGLDLSRYGLPSNPSPPLSLPQ